MLLWAVHLSDGILAGPWLLGGFALAGLLMLLGAWRIRDEEIPQTALLTAAFFVASLIHVRVPPSSVHLLLNGLVGVVLGRRAALAIPVALFLQAALIGHGGFTTLGINTCIMLIPALLAWQLFALLQRVPWVRRPWFRFALVAMSTLVWLLSLAFGGTLFLSTIGLTHVLQRVLEYVAMFSPSGDQQPDTAFGWANLVTFHPFTLGTAVVLALVAAWGERRLENAPEFPIGLLIGQVTVLVTTFLNCLVLVWGGREEWRTLAQLIFLAHLPVALVEGVVLGFTFGFLARVKPEMLGWQREEELECGAESAP
jgi:cobalt/nickel transport system permease protein